MKRPSTRTQSRHAEPQWPKGEMTAWITCGCHLNIAPPMFYMCALHRAAPDLKATLTALRDALDNHIDGKPSLTQKLIGMADQAIARSGKPTP